MLVALVLATLLGLIAGTITGIIPGIHINLVSIILLSLTSKVPKIEPITLAIFIVSMAITHTFIDFIPSVFLGAPDEDTFLSVLPGHRLLKQGQSHQAIILTLYGSISALLIILLLSPIFIFVVPKIFPTILKIFPFLLIFLSLYLILREKKFLLALTIFVLSGFLGLASFSLPIKQPLLPLLTGLFGSSALLIAIKQKPTIPKQEIQKVKQTKIPKKEFSRAILGSIISAPICSFLPGVGSGHAAVIGSEFIKQTEKSFLILLGAINTIVIGISFITVFSIDRTRTGAALAIKQILKTMTAQELAIILITIIISGTIASFIAIKISKVFSRNIHKISYKKLSFLILATLTIIILIFSNPLGLLVFATSTALGIFAILSGARRINLMGVLLIPTIIFYLTN